MIATLRPTRFFRLWQGHYDGLVHVTVDGAVKGLTLCDALSGENRSLMPGLALEQGAPTCFECIDSTKHYEPFTTWARPRG